jgi:hypothetical protein
VLKTRFSFDVEALSQGSNSQGWYELFEAFRKVRTFELDAITLVISCGFLFFCLFF